MKSKNNTSWIESESLGLLYCLALLCCKIPWTSLEEDLIYRYSLKKWLAGRYREFLKGQVEERLKEKARRFVDRRMAAVFSVLSCEMLSFVICVLYVSPCCFCQVKANEEKVVVRVLNLQEVANGVIGLHGEYMTYVQCYEDL